MKHHEGTMITITKENLSGHRVQGKYIQNAYRKFAGLSIGKNWDELFQLEVFLNHYDFSRIIELGTGSGGTTLFMALHCAVKNIKLHTYESKQINLAVKGAIESLGVDVYSETDIFNDNVAQSIGASISMSGRTLLYCDNGNKRDELKRFCWALKSGDVVLVHDYMEEVKPVDITSICNEFNLRPLEESFFTTGFVSMHYAMEKI